MTGAAQPRIADIQILRAIAVLFVIVHHAHGIVPSATLARVATWGSFGTGVDLFFVISGFVIARSLLPEVASAGGLAAKARVIRAFWLRRAFRLWPAAWFWLLVILAASALLPAHVFGTFRTNVGATIAGMLHYANIRFALGFATRPYGASYQYWSLSLEEQFYFVLPLVALLTGRFVALPALLYVLLQVHFNNAIIDWPYRGGGVACGVLLSLASTRHAYARAEPRWLRNPLAGVALIAALLACLVRAGSDEVIVPARYSVIALIATVIVWIASYDRDYIYPFRRGRAALLWLGARSYALYLVHVPVLLLFAATFRASVADGTRTFAVCLGAFALMLVLADATYRFLERPLRHKGATRALAAAREA